VVVRSAPFGTPAAGQHLGTLRVLIRDADEPDTVVTGAAVHLAADRPHTPAGRAADAAGGGAVTLDSLPPGGYEATVQRIGYSRVQFPVEIQAGCRTYAEVHVGRQATCLFSCPATPAWVVITTCARDT
jgi:hypothetical protein